MPTRPEESAAKALSPKQHIAQRIAGATFYGGAWHAADGSLLTAPEAQQAHKAMDKAAAEARAKALLGGGE